MPTPSENHGFDLYDQGETPWTHRDDFEDLDKRLELRGGLSERPADAPDGTLFIETDESDGTPGARWRYDADAGQWVQQPLAAPSVQTDQLSTNARGPSIVVHVESGEVVADGPDGEIAVGDFGSGADVLAVLQAAIDAGTGGTVRVKATSAAYEMAQSVNTDADDEPYCIEMRAGVDLVLDNGATLLYPARTTATSSETDLATPIYCNDVDGWRIRGEGTVDAGLRDGDQTASRRDIMGIKIGCRNGGGATGCAEWKVEGVTIQGAFRHGIESSDGSRNGRINDLLLDDAAGDDDISISINSKHVVARGCTSINRTRDGDWTSDVYEIEDGAAHCGFIDCHAYGPVAGGVQVGKVHTGDPVVQHCWVRDCSIYNPGRQGITVGAFGDSVPGIECIDNKIYNPGAHGINVNAGGGELLNPVVRGNQVVDAGGQGRGIFLKGGTLTNPVVEDNVVDGAGFSGIEARQSGGGGSSLLIDGGSVSGNTILNVDQHGLFFSGRSSNYTNIITIEDNKFRNCGFNDFKFDETAIRAHAITKDNTHVDGVGGTGDTDYSPVVPASPVEGFAYLDDGSNTGSGTKGKRVHDGSAWQDAWTL
jgi:hypothetical protein